MIESPLCTVPVSQPAIVLKASAASVVGYPAFTNTSLLEKEHLRDAGNGTVEHDRDQFRVFHGHIKERGGE